MRLLTLLALIGVAMGQTTDRNSTGVTNYFCSSTACRYIGSVPLISSDVAPEPQKQIYWAGKICHECVSDFGALRDDEPQTVYYPTWIEFNGIWLIPPAGGQQAVYSPHESEDDEHFKWPPTIEHQCAQYLRLGKTTKKIADLFPEECK